MKENKKKIEKTKPQNVVLTAILSFSILGLLLFSLPKTRAIVSWGEGWGAGIWNNYISGFDENDSRFKPVIGWLKSSSNLNSPCSIDDEVEPYEIYFQDSGEVGMRYISGKAWFGIGSQEDSEKNCQEDLPSLGWLDFGADPKLDPVQPPCGSSELDCHAARWYKDGDDDHTGYLDGYAQITSMGENGWVRLKGANYEVRVDSHGILSGYAWNSGIEIDPTLVGNQGLGWIMTDGLQIAECDLDASVVELCEGDSFDIDDIDGISFCPTDATFTPKNVVDGLFTTWTCSRACGTQDGTPVPITPEYGQCGSMNYICNEDADESKLCASGEASTPNYFEKTVTWTCGNTCGKVVNCSAANQCGWIETTP